MDKKKRIKISEYGLFYDTAENSEDPWAIDVCRTVIETKLGYCYQTEHQGMRYFDHALRISPEEGERFLNITKNFLIGYKFKLTKLLKHIRENPYINNENLIKDCVIGYKE